MKDYNQLPNQALPFSPECSAALQRYLPPDLVAALFREDYPTRSLVEAFVQLASTRYAISTYLPRNLVARRLATSTDGPWLEWVEGSLLFADVSGSTALAEQLTVLGREGIEIVTNTLNDFFDTMLTIIKAYGGDLLNFGGDALLVLFRGPDHSYIASYAACELLTKLSGFERTVPGIGTFTLRMRIGVESGCVALASAGRPDALRYSALGNVVNRVARAETYCEKGELVLGPDAWAAVADSARGEELADGYVRVRDLHPRSFSPGLLPRDEPVTAPPEQAIPMLVQQLNRISPYLPTGLLSRILVDPQRPQIEADLRPVTVLFAQIVGLGALVEALEPNQAASLLDAFLRPMQEVIQRFGGVINKLDLADEGDKILAIFGAPVAYEDHTERAARAALAMLDLHEQLNEHYPAWNIKIRLGLNTGIVFAGNVGTAERKEYTVMGDAVNVAARVMGQAAWGEIWCSAATAAPLTPRLRCEDRGRFAVKGKSEPLHLLRIVGMQEQRPTAQAQESPMVGRQAELDWLRERLDAARTKQGNVARIAGDAGMGKSCLVATLLAEARTAGVRVIHVACLSYAMTTPYSPWSEWLKALCGIVAEDNQTERVAKLGTVLDASLDDAREWLPLLAPLVRVEVEETQLTRALEPQQRQERCFELIVHLLRAFANDQHTALSDGNGRELPLALIAQQQVPLLVVFEDLHWADQASLDLWQYVAEQIADLPVFLLGIHRPQFVWGADAPDGADVLVLNELPPEDSETLLLARLGGSAVSAELRQQIVTRANGNPLFLEELLHAVINARGNATTSLDQLPDSLNGLLLARIDQLDEHSRALLRMASVIGQRFPVGVLQSIHLSDLSTLLHRLGRLDAAALTMLEREQPEYVYFFRHALIQEVAYQSLLYARRRELHRRIGEYLEWRHADEVAAMQVRYTPERAGYDLFRDQRDVSPLERPAQTNTTVLFLLAHHYRLSDQTNKAITYLLLAGHASRAAYANDEAIQSYRWALELLHDRPADPRSWEAREALGDVYCTVGDYAAALAEHDAILNAAHAAQLPPAVAAEARRSRGYALEKQGQYAAALDELTRAETIACANPDRVPPLLIASIYADMAIVLIRQGEYERAREICVAGLDRVRPDPHNRADERIAARLHHPLGMIFGMRGDYAQARFHFESALAIQEQIDNFYSSSVLHNNIGYLWQLQSDYERAIEHYGLAEQLARKIKAKYVLSGTYLNTAFAYYNLGKYDEAELGCQAALELCQEMGEQEGIAQVYDMLGQIAYIRGDYDGSLAAFEQALVLQRRIENHYQVSGTLANIAGVYSAMGAFDQAKASVHEAHSIAERLQTQKLRAEALNVLAEICLLEAELALNNSQQHAALSLEQSSAYARQAEVLAEEIGSKGDNGVAKRILGQIAAINGKEHTAYFQSSITIFTEIKNRFELARTQARYAEALAKHNAEMAVVYRKQAIDTFVAIGAQGELARLGFTYERSC